MDSLNKVAADLPQVTIAYSWKYSAIVCLAGVITADFPSLRGNTAEVKAKAPAFGGRGGREGVVWSAPALLESGWSVGMRRGRKNITLLWHLPRWEYRSNSIFCQSAALHTLVKQSPRHRRRQGSARSRRRVSWGPLHQLVQSAERQCGKLVIMQMEVS